MRNVDHLGGLALDHGRAEHARPIAAEFDLQPILDNVDDLVDQETHRAFLVGKDHERLRSFIADADVLVDRDQRHQLPAILEQSLLVRRFKEARIDDFEAGDE